MFQTYETPPLKIEFFPSPPLKHGIEAGAGGEVKKTNKS